MPVCSPSEGRHGEAASQEKRRAAATCLVPHLPAPPTSLLGCFDRLEEPNRPEAGPVKAATGCTQTLLLIRLGLW